MICLLGEKNALMKTGFLQIIAKYLKEIIVQSTSRKNAEQTLLQSIIVRSLSVLLAFQDMLHTNQMLTQHFVALLNDF
jgi:hypothetical protein